MIHETPSDMPHHAHDHRHAASGHTHPAPREMGRAFALGVALNLGFVAIELAFGIAADSLALIADAGHNFSDVIGLLMAWGAIGLSKLRPSSRFTYGFQSMTIYAALANAMLLLLATGGIAWEALRRLGSPTPVAGGVVIWVALAGVVINTATALLFMRGRKDDLNVRGAFLHMAADAAISVGVMLAGIGIYLTGWLPLDPLASLAIACVILIGTWGLLKESVQLALHAVPNNVDPEEVKRHLAELPGVVEVHDLHIWGMSTMETALTAHLVMPCGHPGDAVLAKAVHDIEHEFRIGHVTLQVEIGSAAQCSQANCGRLHC